MEQELAISGFGNMFGIFLPGNDIPDWFTYQDEGPSVCFEVPSIIDCNLDGFVVCIVYSSCPNNDMIESPDFPSISVIYYTKNIIQTSRPATIDVKISPEDHMWQSNISKCKFNLEDGDEVEVIVDFGARFIVKKIGVSLIYDGVLDGTMFHYASTSNEDTIVVSDNEDVKDQAWPMQFERGLHDEEAGPSHGWLEDEPQPKILKCEDNTEMGIAEE